MDDTKRFHVREACDRYGSRDLLEVPTTPGGHSHIVLGDNLLHAVSVTKYVCTDCGRVEEWVNSREDLRRLKAEIRSEPGPAARRTD